jgi:hypothetical protein
VPDESDQDEPVVPMICAMCRARLITTLYGKVDAAVGV